MRSVLIDTARLTLRPMKPDDLEEFTALHADLDVTRFIRPLDRAAVEERLRQDAVEWRERGHGLLALLDRRDDTFLGKCRLRYWPQFDETELGWALRRKAWGQTTSAPSTQFA
jgi:RimJ/RimL family protein N-acetyltransferase